MVLKVKEDILKMIIVKFISIFLKVIVKIDLNFNIIEVLII